MTHDTYPYLGPKALVDKQRAIAMRNKLHDGSPHTHSHLFEDGVKTFEHTHPAPRGPIDPNAARAHHHSNGTHVHPHGHLEYPE